MADTASTPLTEEERAELEVLRAEKARREEEERIRAERAELEALRAERAAASSPASREPHPAAASAPRASGRAAKFAVREEPVGEKTFGQRMVTSDTVDGDGIPTMPAAQKIIIAVAFVAFIAFAVYVATR